MSPSQTLGDPSRCGRVLGPSLDEIIKNAAWRKHSHIVSSCKSTLEKLDTLSDTGLSDPKSTLLGISLSDADFVLNPILLAPDSNYAKVAEPALECTFKLFSLSIVRGEIDSNKSNPILYKIVESVCKVGGIGEEPVELAVLRVLLSAVQCSLSGTIQACAKSVLAQIMLIVFTRAEEDSMDVSIKAVSVNKLLEFTDKNLNEGSSLYNCQNFVSEVMNASEGVPDLKLSQPITVHDLRNGESKLSKGEQNEEVEEEEMKEGAESGSAVVSSKIREDGFHVFKNLGKLSMKFSSQENPDDQILLRGKTLSLELLKIGGDSQIIIDIFVNYDCDVDSPNIFERVVNGLLKTSLGPPSGSITTLSAVQDIFLRHESVQCLVSIIKSMGAWMDQQLKIGDSDLPRSFDSDTSSERPSTSIVEDGVVPDCELHPEMNFELSDPATLEQCRAYKIELQKDISLFNRKPSKGIKFLINTKNVGNSPEEVAAFLKNNTAGLSETVIGDYLGEREEFALRVMHAYVDSFNFKSMDFGEAIRFFLCGFRLPGEAQKIDRIMEKFAERYCKCNPDSFTSADTAYVLAYSVIMLNTDAHNNMVKEKMTKSDFIQNNRGIDDGKDLPEEYLGALYDQIVKNEIKMNADSSLPQNKQANSLNKLLGMDGLLNLVNWKQTEEKPLGANGLLIGHIQEQFNAKTGKSESAYHHISDVAILRFMVEVCWGPMLAAFSVTLDQILGMQTQRDAFVTSAAKFTFLHCAADMKQKNVDAVKKKGAIQNPAVMAVVRGVSYDSTTVRINSSGLVPPEQINQFIANLNLLDQIGNAKLSHVFAHSQRLNSEAIVAFVKALCIVSMSEMQSPTDPRVFSLTKLIEIAHYNMNRIRLVWSRMWHVLSDFFVSVGLSKNLSVASFKRDSTEIRELIVRCISHMVLSHASNVKSGWRSVFMVFTAAADDEQKNIVLLAFETTEKIVREHFPHVTETEATTFMDCIKCLIKFTNSRINSDVSLNAIAFLQFCALKLAEGGLGCTGKSWDDGSSASIIYKDDSDVQSLANIDDHGSCWVPLLTEVLYATPLVGSYLLFHQTTPNLGLSKLTTVSRPAIRKSSLKVLFNILKDHGHLFSRTFWIGVFSSIVLPIFNDACKSTVMAVKDEQDSPTSKSPHPDGSTWDTEILEGSASTAFAAIFRLTAELGSRFSEDEWRKFFQALKEAATSTLPEFMKLLRTMDDIRLPDNSQSHDNIETSSDDGTKNNDLEDDNLQTVAHVVSRMKSHIAVQLLISQQLNTDITLQKKIRIACSIMELTDPPMVHFENEAYQNYLDFLQDLVQNDPSVSAEMNLESLLVAVCENILQLYLNRTDQHYEQQKSGPVTRWVLPLPLAEKEELAARRPLLVLALKALSNLGKDSLRKYIANLFHLLVGLVRIENNMGSGEAERVLTNIFQSGIGPIIVQ
ncbi:hypothetical protein Goshw_030062 [Gossypium schwendimanii]|uniref:SEC7 domain-containing protein n=1 Tax=Gossypium schwendimanii TaxID=34291 RepID=A0A7J9MWN7_GOSSC|nr:hypothetical protein [Gossypium schwendimanii]